MTPSIDGYDFNFYIAEEPGLHEELRGKIRPLDEIEYAILDEQPFTDGEAATHEQRLARLIQSRITSIDHEAGAGQWLAIPNAIASGQVQPALYAKLKALLFSERPNDPDPQDIAKPITASEFLEESHTNLRRSFSLLLNHPTVASTSCATCKEWWFNPKAGKFEERPVGTRLKRPLGADGQTHLPCGECPKGSPDKEHETRPTPRNRKVIDLFFRYLTCGTDAIPKQWRDDQLLVTNLTIAASVWRKHDRNALAEAVAIELLPFMASSRIAQQVA
jgi:hypothetical protein